MKVVVTCDNMYPGAVPAWEESWDVLKQNHPLLRLNVFVIPLWAGMGKNNVFRNKVFRDWFSSRREWVEIGQQGFTCLNPPECTRFKKPQYSLLKRGFRTVASFMPRDFYSFKPPFDRLNSNTFDILSGLGFSCCLYYGKIIMLKMTERPLDDYVIIETSIDSRNRSPLDIKVIFKKINNQLYNLEQDGAEYVTIRELIKDSVRKGGSHEDFVDL